MTAIKRKFHLKEGMRFKNYKIIKFLGMMNGSSGDSRPIWKVQCICGNEKNMVNRYIRRSKGYCGLKCPLKKAYII